MNRTYSIRYVDGVLEAPGVDAPVPGLAIVATTCDCHGSLYAICHVRSGSALLFAHSAEVFGPAVWEALAGADWEQSSVEIGDDLVSLEAVIHARTLVPDYLVGAQVMLDPPDVPPPVDRVRGT